jgi:NAD-dependent SIR2 family protein deacetylase
METDLNQRIRILAEWMYRSTRLVVFTGAGISTESGLPDFRGPDGLWTRRDKGLPIPPTRDWSKATPNEGHKAIVEIQALNKLYFLISQNVDNLHLKSGIRPELLAELHGNMTKIRCSQCEFTMDNFDGAVYCPICGGKMRPSVVDFGQSLPRKDLDEAIRHSRKADLFVVVGSSLVVTPAADMPRIALEYGAKLVIINQGETPLDMRAHLRFNEKIGLVLPPAVKQLKQLIEGGPGREIWKTKD